MEPKPVPNVELIPTDRITIVNPRVRNRKVFDSITQNIGLVGLKRPITVSRRHDNDGPRYDLVCGQGRLEAYRDLGQREIPALVVDADTDDCMIMSLVENLARRQHRAIDLLQDIEGLKRRGYNDSQIAKKTGLTPEYVRGVGGLLAKGEHRLLRAVEAGQIPLTVAVDIAECTDTDVQHALQQAYENNLLRGRRLLMAKRLVELRRTRGKGLRINSGTKANGAMSSTALLRAFQQDTEKKRMMIRKADVARSKLMFIGQALKTLFADEHFVTLLRAEELHTLPRNLADRVQG